MSGIDFAKEKQRNHRQGKGSFMARKGPTEKVASRKGLQEVRQKVKWKPWERVF